MTKELAITIKEKSSTISGGSSTGTTSTSKGFGSLLKPLAAIGVGIALLNDVLRPILTLLKYITAVILLPILTLLIQMVKAMGVDKLADAFHKGTKTYEDKKAGEGLAKSGLNTILGNSGFFGVLKDYVQGLKDLAGKTGIVMIAMRALGVLLLPLVVIFDLLKTSVEGVIWFFKTIWDGGKAMGAALVQAGADIRVKLDAAWSLVQSAWVSIKSGLSDTWEALKGVWDLIKKGLSDTWEALKGVWDLFTIGLGKVWTTLKTVWGTFTDGLTTIWDTLKTAWSRITSALSSAWNAIKNWHPFSLKKRSENAFGGTAAQDGLYKLHAGETVNTSSGSNMGGNTFNITISGSYNTNELVRKLTSEIQRRVGI